VSTVVDRVSLPGCLLFALMLSACVTESVAPPPPNAVAVYAETETDPVASRGDAADDPAIWVNRAEPSLSRIIGTDKDFGVEVYDLKGNRQQRIAAGRTNNIDLRYLPEGSPYSALAAASNRSSNSISLFAVNHEGQLTWLRDSEIATGLTEPYGLCMYADELGLQVFVNDTDGRYQQWGLQISDFDSSNFAITARLLREFTVPSQPEGCAADDEHSRLFLGVEAEGIRVLDARHDAATDLHSLADIDGTILVADVEGMALYKDEEGGYLVASSQGNYSYAVYDRMPPHDYRGSFVVADLLDGSLDGAGETDGLDVSSATFSDGYPRGLLVVQDGENTLPSASQNFKYISWQRVEEALSLP